MLGIVFTRPVKVTIANGGCIRTSPTASSSAPGGPPPTQRRRRSFHRRGAVASCPSARVSAPSRPSPTVGKSPGEAMRHQNDLTREEPERMGICL